MACHTEALEVFNKPFLVLRSFLTPKITLRCFTVVLLYSLTFLSFAASLSLPSTTRKLVGCQLSFAISDYVHVLRLL